jgi:transcriptional regulator with XRE-family HTH domain
MAIVKNAIAAMEKSMKRESVHRANLAADQEILSIRLAELRSKQGVKQSEMGSFTQTAVSKLEKRKDMKLSTLIEYLEDIGMGLEIRVFPKEGSHAGEEETLLRV